MNSIQRTWWESLRHFGMLLSPAEVLHIESDYPVTDLPTYSLDQLRREFNRFEAEDLSVGEWVTWVLENICGFNASDSTDWVRGSNVPSDYAHILVNGESLRPRHLWRGAHGGLLPVFFDSSKRLGIGRGRKTVSDCVQWLRAAHQPLGLLTNGWQWRLLYAGLDYEAATEWDVEGWFEAGTAGPQLEGLRRLLQASLLDPISRDDAIPLVAAIQASRRGQSDLSSELGERVREAVEALVRAHGEVLTTTELQASGADIYRAAVRIVMRLVVVLFAESRDLLPRSNPIYHSAYGLQGLFEQLQRVYIRGKARLGQRYGAWPRILSLFRLLYEGSHHEALQIPTYGGDLFAPGQDDSGDPMLRALHLFETACFSGHITPMPDTVVYEMLEQLTRTRIRVRQGRSSTWTVLPVDFSDLSSEYIGILYEGLLDYELRTAPEEDPILFLAIGNEPALPLTRLEEMDDRQVRDLLAQFKDKGASKVPDEEEGEEAEDEIEEVEVEEEAEEELEEAEEEVVSAVDAARSRALAWTRRACLVGGIVRPSKGKASPEKQLQYERQLDAAALRLVRRVVLPGEWYLVRWGGTRKGAGTFYTRPQLAVPTVHRTLRPLAYQVDESLPVEQWEPRKPEEILDLKVCDPACGSGSFVVASLRYLTDALYRSLFAHGRLEGEQDHTLVQLLGQVEGDREERLTDEYIPCRVEDESFEPRLKALLRRHVVEHCLYGVDLDPLAIELCRLALWIETMDRDLPFSFLDHKIKCGNSLVGCWFDQFAHYPAMAWNREGGDKGHSNGVHFGNGDQTRAIKEFKQDVVQPDLIEFLSHPSLFKKEALTQAASVHDEALEVLDLLHEMPVQDTAERARKYRDEVIGSSAWIALKEAFDLWCACWFWPGDQLEHAPLPSMLAKPSDDTRQIAAQQAINMRFFHWELEFADVFSRPDSGFDAIIGNPPWDIAKPNSMEFFSNIDPLYRSYGKQEAIRLQAAYFDREEIEHNWLDYNAGFRAQSNFMKYAALPYGDPEDAGKSSDRFSLGRGAQNAGLHQQWRSVRQRSRGYADPRHSYRHQGSADINLYKMFLEQGHTLLREGGRLGVIVPSGVYSDHGTRDLRDLFLSQCRWEWLFGFENREKVFDIDSRFKFNPVIVEKGGETEAIRATFMRRRLEDWERAEEYVIPYKREQVLQFSPRTKAILEIQSQRDLEILEKIYANSVLLGDDGPDGWGLKYATEFHMTNDSKLFPPRSQWEEKGYKPDEYSRWLKGNWQPRTGRCPAPEGAKRVDISEGVILSRDGSEWIQEEDVEDVALPIYEGRMIGQFDFSQKGYVSGRGRSAVWRDIPWESKQIEPQYLIGQGKYQEELLDRYLREYQRENGQVAAISESERLKDRLEWTQWWLANRRRVGFIDVTSATNARTMFSALTTGSPCGNSAPILRTDLSEVRLAGVLNSLSYDYVARSRCGGLHLNWFVIDESALPPYTNYACQVIEKIALPLLATHVNFAEYWIRFRDKSNIAWRHNWAITPFSRIQSTAILDAIVASVFGLIWNDYQAMLADCDLPIGMMHQRDLNPKGFWRIDSRKDPELRHTVLTQIAFHDLEKKIDEYGGDKVAGINAFINQNNGEGWMLPETLRLADYGLGHNDRAKESQPVASQLGPRFYDWQLEQSPEESWRECELHARNLLGEEGYRELCEEIEAEKRGEKPVARGRAPKSPVAKDKKASKIRAADAADSGQIELLLEVPNPGKKIPSEAKTEPTSVLDEYHVDGVMMAFRQVARVNTTLDRETLIKRAAYSLGFGRVSAAMEERLRNNLRAAIRRNIIAADGDTVWLATPTMADYDRETLVNTVYSVMRKDTWFEYEDIVRAVAEHLGFERLLGVVAEPVRKAINSLIRQGIIEKKKGDICRIA